MFYGQISVADSAKTVEKPKSLGLSHPLSKQSSNLEVKKARALKKNTRQSFSCCSILKMAPNKTWKVCELDHNFFVGFLHA